MFSLFIQISRRLVMFQVWFMRNNANETLHSYNQRLGRPRIKIKNSIVGKTKYILGSKSWWDYFNELGVIIKDETAIDQLLRFAVYNSKKNFYHKSFGSRLIIQKVNPPLIRTNDPNYKGPQKMVTEGPSVGVKSSGRGWNKPNNNVRGSAWRGRGRGGTTRYQNAGRGRGRGQQQQQQQTQPGQAQPMRGRGRGFTPRGPSQQQQQRAPQHQGGRGQTARGPPQNNQHQQNVRPSPNRNNNQNQNQYQHITPGMQNALNSNNNHYQPGAQSQQQQQQPGAANNQEMPQRQSKSSRNRRRRRNKNKNGNNANQ